MEQYLEAGFEISSQGHSIYETEEEFKWNLAALTDQMNIIQDEINRRNEPTINQKENTVKNTTFTLPDCELSWSRVFEDEFIGTGINVVIMTADRVKP